MAFKRNSFGKICLLDLIQNKKFVFRNTFQTTKVFLNMIKITSYCGYFRGSSPQYLRCLLIPCLRCAPSAVPSMWPAKEKQQAHVLCDSWATRLNSKLPPIIQTKRRTTQWKDIIIIASFVWSLLLETFIQISTNFPVS